MISKRTTHNIILPALALVCAVGCTDDLLDDRINAGDPNAVKFTTSVSRAFDARTRSAAIPLYEPLVLTSAEGDEPLYLHTFETDKVGYRPGIDATSPQTRGMQVESVEDLEKYHTDFMVHAAFKDDGEDYIEWTKTYPSSKGSNIWLTTGTRYWPAEEELSFQAIAPSSEFGNLKSLHTSDGNITFSYTALKGNGSNDAEQQKDLLLALSSCNKAGSVQGRAPLKFHHALSSIKFAVRDVLGGEVVKIQIANVHGSADCHYTADAGGENASFTWSGHGNKTSYGQNFNYKIADRVVDTSDDSQDIILNEKMPEKTFMLIPQQIPDDAEIQITVKFAKTSSMPETTKTLRAKIKDNNVTEWKAGHEYIYTISTSKDNWVYVLEARGNHIEETGAHGSKETDYNVLGDQIYVYSPSKKLHDKYHDSAYYAVRSFRYRANNHDYMEDLPWKATHGDAKQYRVTSPIEDNHELVKGRDIAADQWITDLHTNKKHGLGDHSTKGEIHDLEFAPHHTLTNWPGDIWMQDESAYPGNSESTPWDLSTCGGQRKRTTANCYVIDREGYYCFPLYYGNAMKEGIDNTSAYSGGNFIDYNEDAIMGYEIPSTSCERAQIVWSDAYNAISDVKIETIDNIKMIRFKANKYDLQQGNVIIAVLDKNNTIIWSWHIWITEHWLEPGKGLPHAFNKSSTAFDYTPSSSKRRNIGDVLVEVNDENDKINVSRYMAPYNLGWCDPKNVDYLRRPEYMNFVQYQKDGTTPTGKTDQLRIIQDGERIEYKYANTTYYQFGRKDPIIGFVNHENEVKRSFGDYQYKPDAQPVSIGKAIQNPNVLYCTGPNTKAGADWCDHPKFVFWNNSTNSQTSNTVVKTVYDPCPPGYCVPPSVILRFIGKCNHYPDPNDKSANPKILKPTYFNSGSDTHPPFNYFNGEQVNQFTFRINRIYNAPKDKDVPDLPPTTSPEKVKFEDKDAIWISSTGNRWYTNDRPNIAMGGDNFNWQLAYLWSCTVHTGYNSSHMAYGIALGQDTKKVINEDDEIDPSDNNYCITSYFDGRRSMARPVRAVREELP